MKARIFVSLKSAVHDPQGETIRQALETLGYKGVAEVRQGKFFELSVDAASRAEAEATVREIAERVLANPVIESCRIEVEG